MVTTIVDVNTTIMAKYAKSIRHSGEAVRNLLSKSLKHMNPLAVMTTAKQESTAAIKALYPGLNFTSSVLLTTTEPDRTQHLLVQYRIRIRYCLCREPSPVIHGKNRLLCANSTRSVWCSDSLKC